VPLPGRSHPGDRAPPRVRDQVDLRRHPTPATPQTLTIRTATGFSPESVSFDPSPRALDRRDSHLQHGRRQFPRRECPSEARAVHRPRDGAPGPPFRPPPTPTRRRRGGRSPRATRSAPPARSHPLTSGDAGHTPFSSFRTRAAGPATRIPTWSHSTPVDHLPVIHPAATTDRCPVRQQGLQLRPLLIGQVMTGVHKDLSIRPRPS